MIEELDLDGRITVYEIPEWTDEELRYWWLPETALGPDDLYHIVRPARISDAEKERRKIAEGKNLITNYGMGSFLEALSIASQNSLPVFAGIFSVGNGTITNVQRTDLDVAGDGFTTGARKVPAAFSIVGLVTTITTNFGSGDAVGTLTNCGFYGAGTNMFRPGNPTTTAGTGELNTHMLLSLVKGASAIAVAYTFTLANVLSGLN